MNVNPETVHAEREPSLIVTTADEVVATFKVTEAMERKFKNWHDDESRSQVVDLVTRHRTAELYRLTLDDVRRVCTSTDHALGNVERRKAESVAKARDWWPKFAFTHVMHHYLEQQQELPTWQHLRQYLLGTDEGMFLLGNDATELSNELLHDGVPQDLARDAIQWRVGNAYYSFLREVYTIVTLRSRGLDVRVHPLADALFRVDAWMDNTVISLFVENENYRRQKGLPPTGRKDRPSDLLRGALQPFRFYDIELGRATAWGEVHLPSNTMLDRATAALQAARSQSDRGTSAFAGIDHDRPQGSQSV
ncbi:hypothetical protein G3I59_44315 [Amycolatopsis rubida]|uniref:Uncharacterized protein n=1 Tax=Amycolatopsis rubida TaxID=112413 RepID=A0ABX0C6X2_9PSEU|nr:MULTISPECIES: hypothetical protein [Amycolatopsis]MYW97457.1 hypothetical protein [Amycolatopsis rubida]NEC62442.1 hypothetical protein [Amycolatopsis rubida]OAP24331.1 hypothetical protein A4R44_04722 [Amycolatopsis sp. M39]